MAIHSNTLAWKTPWTEEPGRLQFMGSLRVRHDWATSLSLFTFMPWRRKWQPTPVFLPGESQGQRNLVGCCLWGRTESDMTEATKQQQQQQLLLLFSLTAEVTPSKLACANLLKSLPFFLFQVIITSSPSSYSIAPNQCFVYLCCSPYRFSRWFQGSEWLNSTSFVLCCFLESHKMDPSS